MSTNAEESLEWMNKTGVNQMIGLGGIKPSKLGEPAGPIISLAILLDNSNIAREWKMSKYDTEMLDFLIKHKGQNINPKQAKDMLVKGVSQDHLLAWANMHNKNDVYDTVHSFEKPEFPVNGKDLLAMGYRAGPQLGQLLTDLQDQWMKSNYKLSKEDLLKKVPVQESIVLEKVSRFMTGHGITYKGKKHDEMEVEVVGVDNEKRQYQVMIMRPEEYFGTNVMMSARFMHRGPWVKTKIPDYMGAFAKSDVKEWIYPAIQGAAHLARTYGPKIASKLMTDPAYKIAGAGTSGGGAAIGAYNYVKDKFDNKKKKQTKSSGGPSIPQAEMTEAEESKSEVFVDMDGVLVDFFTEWAKLMNVKTYRDIPKREIPKALKKIVDTPNFWENLPPLAGYKELLTAIKQMHGSYKILSSPLANDPNVDPGKREWVNKHLGFFKPEKVIIDHNKSQYAKQPDGTPNILIDDYGKNVNAWKQAGGVAIKHHTSTTNDTINQLKSILTNEVKEAAGVGRVIPGINTSVDVGPNEIIKQAKKFGNDVDKDGFPKKLLRTKKK
jgi:5'(3')-deoxyribonucleotidase